MNAARGVGGFAIARRESSPTGAADPSPSRRFTTSRDGSLRGVLGFDSRRLHLLALFFQGLRDETRDETCGTTLSTGSVVSEAIAGAPLALSFPSTALPRTYTALAAANGTSLAVLFTTNCSEETKAAHVFTLPAAAVLIDFAVQYSSGVALTDGTQQVSVKLLDANTSALLANLYNVGSGSPQSGAMTAVSVNIAALAGRMVRLEIDVQGRNHPLYAAFDAFRVQ